jgi:hypothetical protein
MTGDVYRGVKTKRDALKRACTGRGSAGGDFILWGFIRPCETQLRRVPSVIFRYLAASL